MKKIALIALASTSAFVAIPAAAQSATGTITLTGTVGEKCLVLGGEAASSTFSDSVDFDELSDSDGTLRDGLATEFDNAIGTFRVVCTTSTPVISVDAEPLQLAGATTPADGYDNSIDFEAHVTLELTAGGPATFDNDSRDPALVSEEVDGRLAGEGDNLSITADNFRTNTPDDILEAGDYQGTIAITIAPAA